MVRPSLPERLEASVVGRRLLSCVLAASIVAVVLWNLPESPLRATALPVIQPYVNSVGLDQYWELFAPDPPRQSLRVIARVEYADGTLALWEPPRNDRWLRWMSTLVLRPDPAERERTAAWIGALHRSRDRAVVRVELVQRRGDLRPPGSGQVDPPEHQSVFYTYDVPGDPGR